ncbi:type I polyketide synthase [Desulfonema ishimotonii]|uniref:Type I polyketide synthase n=1 Tax=Desulfonema ishimotonii TaxID=45657 RepID=A0A401FUT6_9BACT|nr:SDR family NAD(P)-dependent oxidoreductase [Desulfonema ishimotonii]GBC60729.1 type I polyketide synthase [Desulfonema ishimotonii]
MKAVNMAYENAGADPGTVELIEAHGTGTLVGDAVEFSGLKQVFSKQAESDNGSPDSPLCKKECAVGSVKSMIGHTKAAAGAAGLIKAVLSLYHKVLPPTLKISMPDPKLGIENTPFYLNTESRPWVGSSQHPRRAGVSAFGFGGSNFHMVLEEYEQQKQAVSWDGSVEIIALSDTTREGLASRLSGLKAEVEKGLSDDEVTARAAEMRAAFSPKAPHRLLLVLEKTLDRFENLAEVLAETVSAFKDNLQQKAWNVRNTFYGGPEDPGKVAFIFPGQGSQYVEMGRDLACRFPEALEILEQVNGAGQDDERLSDFIYPRPVARTDAEKKAQDGALRSTDIAQPAIGAVSAMMMKILDRFGLKPDATCGHSFGELVALCAAGWIDTDTLFQLAFTRGRLMADAGRDNAGTMTAVKAPLAEIDALIKAHCPDVVLANRNSPDQGVLSGTVPDIEKAESVCTQRGFRFRRLPVSAAFHSHLLRDARKPFADAVQKIRMTPTDTPVFSNMTGQAYPTDPEAAKTLLGDQLLSPVDFVNEIKSLFNMGVRTFVEIGPKSVLTGLVKAILSGLSFNALSLDATAGRRFGIADLARLLCYMAALGHPVNLENWEEPVPRRRKQRMNIPLSGANYRSERRKKPGKFQPVQKKSESGQAVSTPSPSVQVPAAAKKTQRSPKPSVQKNTAAAHAVVQHREQQAMPDKQPPVRASVSQRTVPDKPTMGHIKTMTKNHAHHVPAPSDTQGYFVADAFRAVQEGLKSMQALQMQTAETHKKFLETQNQASRTLQEMMESTHRLAEVSMGMPQRAVHYIEEQVPIRAIPEAVVSVPPRPAPAPVAKAEPPVSRPVPQPAPVVKAEQTQVQPKPSVAPVIQAAPAPNGNGKKKIASAMLSVVSDLTGYPSEMLTLEMDIEADLGIDSIKRVEILSAFEEKMPGLPTVSPEVMGSLRTLGQIVEYLTGTGIRRETETAPPAEQPAAVQPVADPSPAPAGNRSEVEAAMLSVVSDLTGYPSEMLTLEMDIEADLGIDSIKRVEILSAFEEKMPGLPVISPDMMGTLRTLGQIVDYLTGNQAAPAADAGAVPSVTPPPATDAPQAGAADRGSIESAMLSVVSDLTGYPSEMLTLEMDIEADLGIDSIKRVEILSAFEEKMPGLPAISPDMMGTLRTLGQIVDYLDGGGQSRQTEHPVNIPTPPEIIADGVKKKIISPVRQPPEPGSPVIIPTGRPILVTRDGRGLGEAVVEEFAARGMAAVLASPSQLRDRDDLSSPGGLILLADAWADQDGQFLKEAFALTRDMGPGLLKSGAQGGAIFGVISRMDGAFGFRGTGFENPFQGGLAGLAKTASAEWPDICCHALDISPDWQDNRAIAKAIADELIRRGPTEVGLDPEGRSVLNLEPAPWPQGTIDLAPGDVVVVTGGARGVTAATAHALARQVRPTLVLLGRSPLPSAEPEWLVPLSDESAIKKAILTHDFGGHRVTPVQLGEAYGKYMANREIQENLDKLRAAGATVLYHSADVRKADKVRDVLNEVRAAHGPVRALIHGAGTLADRFIVDKTPEQFARVFDTKVGGLEALLDATADDPLRYLILFSSVAARMGNKGQADYAMANEVLNKIGQKESLNRPDCRVISFNWGPWDGGMVSPALKREFVRNHIELIPVEEGAMCMVAEMTGGKESPVEMVIGGGLGRVEEAAEEAPVSAPSVSSTPEFTLSFKREVDTEQFPILKAHVLDGKPVVPFALMAEWIGHGALHSNPGLFLHGLDDMRLLKGIRLEQTPKPVRLMAGKVKRNGPVYEVPVELRDGVQGDAERVHSRATAILTDMPVHEPPVFTSPVDIRSNTYDRSVSDVYRDILFHGAPLHGIREIRSCSPHAMVARLAPAPPPAQWVKVPLRSGWIGDPLMLDAAFQMAIVWCYEEKGLVSLPGYVAAWRQYVSHFPSEGVTAVLEVRETGNRKMKGDFTFLDDREKIVARLTGYEAIMDDALFKAFKPLG